MLPSFEHAQRELKSHGLNLPLKEVRRIATPLGAQVLTRRKRDLLDYREGRMPAGQELAGKGRRPKKCSRAPSCVECKER